MRKVLYYYMHVEKEFVGLFHQWVNSSEPNIFIYGLIEAENGEVLKIQREHIRFLPHPEQNSLKNYNAILAGENGREKVLNFGKGSRD